MMSLPSLNQNLAYQMLSGTPNQESPRFKLTFLCRATVLIETITAAFEMDEILYEMRQHSAGLNCGRWDYIFRFDEPHDQYPFLV